MKFTDQRPGHHVITRYIAVEDGPTHAMAYSTTGKKFRVEHVKIEYVLGDNGTWQITYEGQIQVTGTVLKKDGSDSLNDHTRMPDGERTGWGKPARLTEEWEWLTALTEAARPTGVPVLPDVTQ